MSITRCQIYCRTSSEEGLSQDFNSLDAQTEACEAFIKSLAALSWRNIGGGYFEKGHLYNLLKNPIYVGQIRHKDKVYDGEHEGIISQDQFDRVQQIFVDQTRRKRAINTTSSRQDYRGRIYDESGRRMLNTHTFKGGKQYRYYVSAKTSNAGQKVSAFELERAVKEVIQKLKDEPSSLAATLGHHNVSANKLTAAAKQLDPFDSVE